MDRIEPAVQLLLIQPQHRRDLRDLQALIVPQPHQQLILDRKRVECARQLTPYGHPRRAR